MNIIISYENPYQQLICIFFMPEAYVLLNCELGSEGSLVSTLRAFEHVKEVREIFGAYDILARLESSTAEDLTTVTTKIRKLGQIQTTTTLLTIDE